jgi:hypothetical protein
LTGEGATSDGCLDERVASALTPPVRSVEVAALVEEARRAAAAAEARAAMADALFTVERLRVAVEALTARRRALADDEEDARRRERYEALKKERDQLAHELRALYSPFATGVRRPHAAGGGLRSRACGSCSGVAARAWGPVGRGVGGARVTRLRQQGRDDAAA